MDHRFILSIALAGVLACEGSPGDAGGTGEPPATTSGPPSSGAPTSAGPDGTSAAASTGTTDDPTTTSSTGSTDVVVTTSVPGTTTALDATTSAGSTSTGAGDETTSAGDETTSAGDESTSTGDETTGEPACFPLGSPTGPVVHVVYLVPTDRPIRPEVQATLEKTIRHLQYWYQEHMSDNSTFQVHEPIVETYKTTHPAAWYGDTANGNNPYLYFWNNVLGDAFALTGGGFNQPQDIWLYYIDADPKCMQLGGGGTSGVATLPANDIRGLVGEVPLAICPGDPINQNRCRWVGGLGHELGHAFGLPHPAACEDNNPNTPCPDALMYLGYTTYPTTTLTAMDQTTLGNSLFFSSLDVPSCDLDCDVP